MLLELSARIRRRLEEHPLWRSSTFPCIYVSSKHGEVETHSLILGALSQGKKVCVPVTEPRNKSLYLVEIKGLDNLVPGHYGILEPPLDQRSPRVESGWDLIVVPGVAFDHLGHRLGFGKGYYDRLLAEVQVPKIALAFSFQVVEPFETLPHDVDMDLILTENETIQPG